MQEEVTGKSVALIVDGAKMSEQVLEKALKKFLEEMQKGKQPKMHRGKQSLKQLAAQNAGLANIEITDQNIKAFTQTAKSIMWTSPSNGIPPPSSPATRCFSRTGTRTRSRRLSRSSQAERYARRKSPPSGSGWRMRNGSVRSASHRRKDSPAVTRRSMATYEPE